MPPDWTQLISEGATSRPTPRTTVQHRFHLSSATRPQVFECDDTRDYAVKFSQNQHGDGRGIFNEQVVALAGQLISAAVPYVELVEVPELHAEDLRTRRPTLGMDFDAQAGIHHGSRWVADCTDKQALAYMGTNRSRLAGLDVLYTWVTCNSDFQLIYKKTSPNEVLSVDHTEFFPGGLNWDAATLAAEAGTVAADPNLAPVAATDAERRPFVEKILALRPQDIARIVAQPPDDWGIGEADRQAVASYLYERREPVAQLFNVTPGAPDVGA
jgi:hypothetical protein